MRYFHRLAKAVNVAPLAAALARQPELWNERTLRTTHPGSVHSQVDDIWLRFNDTAEYERTGDAASLIDQHESVWYPPIHSLPQARPLIFDLMAAVQGERLGRVLITRLEPGKRILPHEDSGDHAAYYERHHVVVQNEPGSLFRAGNETVTMKAGEVWWFDNSANHEVVNNSVDDRIVMIVDIRIAKAAFK